MSNGADLPEDVHALQALVLAQRASFAEQSGEIERLVRDMAERELEIERLKAQIDKLKRMADSTGRRNDLVKSFSWRVEV
ncbi:hypothetical protein [Paraburkholderia sp. Ac-20347]|uniref:hypothetical protein n=1 Tax=Paraburkholderia sp. Ac-20347 TaxID=2703892 RepID=UPI00197FD46A